MHRDGQFSLPLASDGSVSLLSPLQLEHNSNLISGLDPAAELITSMGKLLAEAADIRLPDHNDSQVRKDWDQIGTTHSKLQIAKQAEEFLHHGCHRDRLAITKQRRHGVRKKAIPTSSRFMRRNWGWGLRASPLSVPRHQ